MLPPAPLLIDIDDPRAKNRLLVGGKIASLAQLATISRVPPTVAITKHASEIFMRQTPDMTAMIEELDTISNEWIQQSLAGKQDEDLQEQIFSQGQSIRQRIHEADLPPHMAHEIKLAYQKLASKMNLAHGLAIRSSGIAEDLSHASFAGEYDTFLNQRGLQQVCASVKSCLESQFTERVINYRNEINLSAIQNGNELLSHREASLAIAIQGMVDAKTSGVAFSRNSETGAPIYSIEATHGLGQALVGSEVTPDLFFVDPARMHIVGRHPGDKAIKTVYAPEGGTMDRQTTRQERQSFALSDHQVIEVAKELAKIDKHYGIPIDYEFAFDPSNTLWSLQARSDPVARDLDPMIIPMKGSEIAKDAEKHSRVVFKGGITGSPGVGIGQLRLARSAEEAKKNVKKGDALLARMTTPDWTIVFRKTSAIVTDIGGRNSHAANVGREKRKPVLVGTGNGTNALAPYEGSTMTVDASNRIIYEGALPLEETGEDINVQELIDNPTQTALGVILSDPEEARKIHGLKELGDNFLISLLRIEFLLGEIGIHPKALLAYDKGEIVDELLREKIQEKIAAYGNGKEYYIKTLSEGLAQFAALFPQSPITIRTTDFKTNEYSELLGGNLYEAQEENPMMGWRGLIRSLCPENREATEMELEAIKRARDMGYPNIQMMFPVVRDPIELIGGKALDRIGYKGIFELMDEVGLKRGENGIPVGIMVETPANVVRIDEFIDTGINFVSFGSNDLAQFTLASDRDNELIQKVPWYQEINPAVTWGVEHVIKQCKTRGVKTGICGNAPSNSPTFVKMLIAAGIDSIGVMPDRFLSTYRFVREAEAQAVSTNKKT